MAGARGPEPGEVPVLQLLLGGGDGERERWPHRVRLGGGVEAAHRGAAPDAAGVEADDVKACPQHRRKELDQVADEVDTRNARPAGVDHQRPDPLAPGGRRTPDHRQRDLGPARVVVVQRRTNRCALEAVAARLPRHRARRQTRNRPRVRHGGRPASHRGQGPCGGGLHQRSGHRGHQGEAGRCDGNVQPMPGTCGLGEHEPPRLRRKPARRAGCTPPQLPRRRTSTADPQWGQLYRWCSADGLDDPRFSSLVGLSRPAQSRCPPRPLTARAAPRGLRDRSPR